MAKPTFWEREKLAARESAFPVFFLPLFIVTVKSFLSRLMKGKN